MSEVVGQSLQSVETHTPKELERQPLVLNNRPLGWITEQVCSILEGKMPKWWNVAFVVSFLMMLMCFGYIGYLVTTGVGVWGLNHPVAWGWAIVNFVFWIGIGHAGTLISAILFLLRQKWRCSINRGGGDDNFRGDLRGHFPWHSRGPYLAGVVAIPDS